MGWALTAMLCPRQDCVYLCSGLALDWSWGSSKIQETRFLQAPHAATCCGNLSEQGLLLLCLTSKYSIRTVCTRCSLLSFTQLLMLQLEALTFLSCFFVLHVSSLPLLFLLEQQQEVVQLWLEFLCLKAIVAGYGLTHMSFLKADFGKDSYKTRLKTYSVNKNRKKNSLIPM